MAVSIFCELLGFTARLSASIHQRELPFPFDPPYVPRQNPCGWYQRSLNVEPKPNKRYLLNFEGVDSCLFLYVNGQFVGYSQISHCISEFNVTNYLQSGGDKITVIVLKWCDGSYLEDQDKFRMSGIFRDVYWQAAGYDRALTRAYECCLEQHESAVGKSGVFNLGKRAV